VIAFLKTSPLYICTIIVTSGPSCRDPAILERMLEAGMNIARLNFSHGTHEYHAELIESIRTAVSNYSKKIGRYHPLAVAIDTKGSEIRTGVLEGVNLFEFTYQVYTCCVHAGNVGRSYARKRKKSDRYN
jgi:pyruvate kinase